MPRGDGVNRTGGEPVAGGCHLSLSEICENYFELWNGR